MLTQLAGLSCLARLGRPTRTSNRSSDNAVCVLLLFFLVSSTAFAWTQSSSMPDMPDMPGMNHKTMHAPAKANSPAAEAKRLADKRESEFNHRLAGFFVLLAGIFALLEPRFRKRWPIIRYGWGICFLAVGVFLLIFSDTEIWPFGPQSLWYALSHEPEDLQHKIFALILLAIGAVQIQTARGRLKEGLLAYLFPVMTVIGSILLIFHTHGGDMSAAGAMQKMQHIETEHARFAAAGLAIAVTSVLAQRQQRFVEVCRRSWPLLLILLGGLLMLYTE